MGNWFTGPIRYSNARHFTREACKNTFRIKLKYFHQALENRQELAETRDVIDILDYLGSAYMDLGDSRQALEYVEPGFRVAII